MSALIRLMTFNIRCDNDGDGDNSWPHRSEAVRRLILDLQPDVIGTQEVLPHQGAQLLAILGDRYDSLSRGRDVDPGRDEASPLWWRRDRWRPDAGEQGTFWLSESPDTPGSISWDSSLPRICTWARLVENATGRGIYVYNTHLDHRSAQARRQGVALLARRIDQRRGADEPAVLMGDLNADEQSDAVAALRSAGFVDTFRAVHPDAAAACTFHAWSGDTEGAKIDYIFSRGALRSRAANIHAVKIAGRWPSDHFPVTADLDW